MTLYDVGLIVGHAPDGVGLDLRLGVLDHDEAVLVIYVGDGKGRLGQAVEEGFLRIAIVLEGLMVVQVVAGQVGKDASHECQTADTLLRYGVAGAFHEGVFASCLHHLGQQLVQLNGVGGGMVSGEGLVIHVVAHRGQQSALVSHFAEHII